MPICKRARICSWLLLAGPIVATIFVLRRKRKVSLWSNIGARMAPVVGKRKLDPEFLSVLTNERSCAFQRRSIVPIDPV